MAKKETEKIEELNFEQTIDKLTEIVNQIEQGQISLQESLGQYEKGMELIKHCRDILEQAEKRIEKISAAKNTEKQQ